MHNKHRTSIRSLAAIILLLAVSAISTAADREFKIRFDESVRAEPFSGRVYLLFSRSAREPRFGPSWFNPEMFVSRDVKNWKPGETITFSTAETAGMLAHPRPLEEMKLAGYRAQAIARFNPIDRRIGTGEGNGFSQVVKLTADATPEFVIKKVVPQQKFLETNWSKLLEVRSKLLSEFHGREVTMKAAVILPASYYDKPNRRYPVLFNIPGFGGTHFSGQTSSPAVEKNERDVEFLRVTLDASCPLGHHVFADSANNGPVGTALVEELIPALDKQFRTVAKPTARFLTGHSSGGWSSLWVQVSHPDFFAGTWSTAPDPVDFRDFQQIDLYNPGENMYVDAEGKPRPLARVNGKVRLWYKGFADMEWTLGPGGQLHSFEAAFSPRGKDGKPLLVWNRKTGKVNTDVARTWEKYDIRLVLERNWKTLGPKLAGKLHVFMGDQDTFYLDGATVLLKESLEKPGSDAIVEIHQGKDHGSLMTPKLRRRIRREMVATFLKHHPEWPEN
jgi:Putative esterase